MKKFFFIILLIFFSLLSRSALSDKDARIKKIFEGLDIPSHISKNEFISPSSIFVLEHKLAQIIEIQNYDKEPKLNPKPILNIKSLVPKNEKWEQGLNGFAFSPNFEKDKYIFSSSVL